MFDIELRGCNKEFEEWCLKVNRITKRVSTTLYKKIYKPNEDDNDYYIVLYCPIYINEEQVFRDTIHELTETSLGILLLRMFPRNINVFLKIPLISHLLTEISHYDDKEPIILCKSVKYFKNIKKFLEKIGCKYEVIKGIKIE
jgi:hypothetical protein